MAASVMALVTVYSKPGCHLCEKAVRVLQRIQAQHPFALEEVNIQTDPALLAEYGEQIPVVLLNGAFLFEYEVDETRLRQILEEVN
jgi:glutaredoxin